MNASQQRPPGIDPLEPQAAGDVLHRILAAVEKDRRRGVLELIIAIILSLTTLATTWCGYQSRQWGSFQSSNQAAADTAERQAAENTIVGLQMRTFDGIELLELWAAMRANDKQTADTIAMHMRPQLRQSVEASIAAGALKDPSVPGPLQRPEYVLPIEQDAQRLREEAVQRNTSARDAGQHSDSYVLLTLMFASVLFFGGITGTFTARRVRIGLACVAALIFLITVVSLVALPVYRG